MIEPKTQTLELTDARLRTLLLPRRVDSFMRLLVVGGRVRDFDG
jgi:hypothetical protein